MAFTWNQRVLDDALRMAGKGLKAATIYAANCTKEILSVPAPRVRFTNANGAKYYVAGWRMNNLDKLNPAKNPYLLGAQIANTGMPWMNGNYGPSGNFKFPKGGMGPPVRDDVEYMTAPAIKGEPPRKLSGFLRRSIAYEFLDMMKTFEGGDVATKGRVGTNAVYARALEYHHNNHEFLGRVFRERRKEIEQVLYDNATGGAAL